MDKHLNPDGNLTPSEVLTLLQGESIKSTEEFYYRPLSEDEIVERKNRSLTILDEQDALAIEKKEANDGFKTRASSLSKELGTIRNEVHTGTTRVQGLLYYLPDYNDRMVGIYTSTGQLIQDRPMKPEERQLRISHSRGTGTDD